MPEDTKTTTNGNDGKGADPKDEAANATTQKTETTTTAFDPSKISDEEFGKVFDDKRLFQHSRFKDLTAGAQKAKEYETAEAKRKEEELKKKGEFEELAKQKDAENLTLKEKLQTERINNSLLAASTKLGVVDSEAILKLIDRSAIKVDETTGTITGVDEALKALTESKPYLVGKQGATKIGSGTAPAGQNNSGELKRFKHSEIRNPEFYRKNEKDILASMAAGLIEDDINK